MEIIKIAEEISEKEQSYELEEQLGEGSFAWVYRGRQMPERKEVALKLFKTQQRVFTEIGDTARQRVAERSGATGIRSVAIVGSWKVLEFGNGVYSR